MANWTQVSVTPQGGGAALLNNGTGSGDMGTFACSAFPAASRPVVGTIYNISALEDGDQFPMDWDAKCTFSGGTSEFKTG
ncbi:hypothetical protein KUH32_14455 [Thalassococcus sp. CAU 1522]|uniref:Uncharacterized protein n=1 Tax=Thalassococcus arenae TaxID=2851652 RepID=A0ABS6NAD4_9RHOB|nr:hypothetical protein [Thalassococcus arenae]MBV2360965.1 hypothetical protein [Thalassococcus arenae]